MGQRDAGERWGPMLVAAAVAIEERYGATIVGNERQGSCDLLPTIGRHVQGRMLRLQMVSEVCRGQLAPEEAPKLRAGSQALPQVSLTLDLEHTVGARIELVPDNRPPALAEAAQSLSSVSHSPTTFVRTIENSKANQLLPAAADCTQSDPRSQRKLCLHRLARLRIGEKNAEQADLGTAQILAAAALLDRRPSGDQDEKARRSQASVPAPIDVGNPMRLQLLA